MNLAKRQNNKSYEKEFCDRRNRIYRFSYVVELQQSGYDVVTDNLSKLNADVVDNIEVTGIRPAFEKLDCLDYEGMDKLFTKICRY